MPRLTIHPARPEPQVIRRAAAVLRDGGLVAFPTETVYGLGARALVASSVRRIYEAKGRPGWNPLIAHVSGPEMARAQLVSSWNERAEALARAFWPGPLTLVLPRMERVPEEITAGLATVAVRAPAHPVAAALIAELGEPVAAPSANRFQEISPTTANHVEKSLGNAVDLILDGGPCGVGVESTVVDVSGTAPALLRAGGITLAQLQQVLPDDGWHVGTSVKEGVARASPGQVLKHYAPRVPTRIVAHGDASSWSARAAELGGPIGTLSFTLPPLGGPHQALPLQPEGAQSLLYAAMHALEDAGPAAILMELPPDGEAWDAVRDRMTRAAA